MTGATIRRALVTCALALGLAWVAVPASAQSGQVKGKVVDAKGQPVEGAKISISNVEMSGRKLRNEDEQEGGVHPDRPISRASTRSQPKRRA